MSNENHDNSPGKKVFLSALLAGAAGYLAGILTAPKSGRQTRQDIADKAGELKDDAEAQLKKAQTELNELAARAKNQAAELSDKAKAELSRAQTAAKTAQTKALSVLKAVKNGTADDQELQKALDEAKKARDHLRNYLKS